MHFQSAAGLTPGALVYFSGVTVGSVDSITLLDDNTVDVILAVQQRHRHPAGIEVPHSGAAHGGSELAHRAAQNGSGRGKSAGARSRKFSRSPSSRTAPIRHPSRISSNEGQGEVRKLDILLTDLEQRKPRLLDTLQSTMNNANDLTVAANASLAAMQTNLLTVGNNFAQLSTTLNSSASIDSRRLSSILTQFDATSISLNRSMTPSKVSRPTRLCTKTSSRRRRTSPRRRTRSRR